MSTISSGSSTTSSSAYSAFSSSLLRPSFRSSLFDLDAEDSEFLENQETLLRTAASIISSTSSGPSVYQYPPPRPTWQTREVADSVLRIEMMLIEAVQEMRLKNWKKKKSGSGRGSKKSRRRPRMPEPEPEPERLAPKPGRTDRESKSEMLTEYGTTAFDSEAEEIILQARWRQLMKNPNAQITPFRRYSTITRSSKAEPERTDGTWTSYGDAVGPAYTENTGRATGGYGYGTAVQTPITMPLADYEQYTHSLGGQSPISFSISYATPSPAAGGHQEMRNQPSQDRISSLLEPTSRAPEVEIEEEIEMPRRGRKRTPKGSKSSGRTHE